MIYILFPIISSLAALVVVRYRRMVATINNIREGCFIYLPYHVVPKYLSLRDRSFDADEIPTYFFILLLLHEDDRFLMHRGFNIPEVKQAISDSIREGRLRGGSSITQQTAKSLFTNGKISFKRKALETLGTIALERNLTKEEILYLYLSTLRLVSLVSSLPDILHFLLEKKNPALLSIDQSEFIINLIPAPTSRITKIRGLGVKVYNFNYSYEKLLLLMRIFKNKRISESSRGLNNYIDFIRDELLPHSSIYRVDLSAAEELDSILKASTYMTRIEKSLNKVARNSLRKTTPEYILTNWQSAFVHLLSESSNSKIFKLSEREENHIIELASRKRILHLLSSSKAKSWGLSRLTHIITDSKTAPHDGVLGGDTKKLLETLAGEEITEDEIWAPNFGHSIEHFFSLR